MLSNLLRDKVVKPIVDNEQLLLLCVAEFTFMMGAGVIIPVLPRYAQTLGATAAMIGILISIFGLARFVTNAPSGFLSQRYGRKSVLIAGCVVTVIGSALCGLAGDLWQLLVFRFIAGAGSGIFTTGAMIYLTDISTTTNRGRMMSAYQGALLLGMTAGPAIGGFIAALVDDRAAFFMVSLIAVVCTFWVGLRLPETVKREAPTGDRARKEAQAVQVGKVSAWSIMANPSFLLIGFVTFGIFFTRTGAQFNVIPLMAYNNLGLGPAEVGLALTLLGVLNFVGVPASGWAADRLGRKAAIVPGCILAGVGLWMFTSSTTYALFLLAAAVHGMGKGLGAVAPAAYAGDLAPKGMVGATMGIYRTIGDFGYVLGPPVLGWFVDAFGFNSAIGFSTGLLVVPPLLFLFFAKETLDRSKVAKPKLEPSSS